MRIVLVLLCLPAVCLAAETPDFARDVQPILTAHCAGCHNADEASSGFRVDGFEHLTRPIEAEDALQQGPSLTAGTAETSRFYRLMAGLDEPRMPPADDGDPVPAEQLAIVKAWIDGGAPGPSGEAMQPALVVPNIAPASSPTPITTALSRDGVLYTGAYGVVRKLDSSNSGWAAEGLSGKVTDLATSPDGKTLYAATGTTGLIGRVIGFDSSSGKQTAEFTGHRDTIYTLAISPDGTMLATGSYDRDVIIWDTTSGNQLRTLAGHNGAIFDVAFDPKGELIASASGDETVKIWSVSTGERLDTLPQPEGEVNAVTFTPDGRFVLAGSADNRIRKWQIRSRGKKAINPLRIARFAHEDAVTHLEQTPDGTQVVTAAADKVVRVWSSGPLTQLASFGPIDDVVATLDTAKEPGKVTAWLMNGSAITFDLPTTSKPATRIADAIEPVFPPSDVEEQTATEAEPNNQPAEAIALTLPVRAKGVIGEAGDVDLYSFEAKRGEQWIVEVEATRGSVKKEDRSKLDSFVEVLDTEGRPIERVLLQAVRDSYFTFRGKDSTQSNDFRVFNWEEMELGELFYSNGEVCELYSYPNGPDSGFWVFPGTGQRHLRFDTTGVAHALGEPAYIVKAYPPGSEIAANGLPMFPVYFENDDDASRDAGTDSVVHFTAPADGRYVVRVTDARGFGSDAHNYTLRIRPRVPDFTARMVKAIDKLPAGSSKETGVRINRRDGFERGVSIEVTGLPTGLSVPDKLSIEPGQFELLFPVTAAADAVTPTEEQLKAIEIIAVAEAEDGREIRRSVSGLGKLEIDEKPAPISVEVVAPMVDGIPTIDLRPGETVSLMVKLNRGDFKGLVEFGKEGAGRNLPFGVFVDNIGLNGLMIPENQTEQEFFITASPVAVPQVRTWHLNTGQGGGMTSNVVRLRVLADEQKVAER